MHREDKEQWVASLHGTLCETAVVVVAHYSGLTVAEMSDLRARLREAGVGLKVTKNRLAKRALGGTPYEGLEPLFRGPTVIAFSHDPVAAARVTAAFAKANAKLILLGGGLGARSIDVEAIKALATLPSLDELRGAIVGLLNAPAASVARVLAAPGSQMVGVLKAYGETGGAGEADEQAA
jgi:large subunit ribosomal protein L10